MCFEERSRRIHVQLSNPTAVTTATTAGGVRIIMRIPSRGVDAVRCGDDLADDVAAEYNDRERDHDGSYSLHTQQNGIIYSLAPTYEDDSRRTHPRRFL